MVGALQKLKVDDLPYLDPDDLETYNHTLVSCGSEPATVKQLKFVNYFLLTGSSLQAYNAAGYRGINQYDTNNRSRKVNQVVRRTVVSNLLKIAMRKWCTENRVTRESLATKALEAYDNADTVRDQLNALKLVAKLSGFG